MDETENFRFGNFVLDTERQMLLADGAERPLRPKSFALLRFFVENPGRLLDRDAILRAVWPGVFVTDDSLSQAIRDVRRALGDGSGELLRTYPRRGYSFTLAVERARPAPAVPLALPDRPSIAVLPFQTMSAEADQAYFADGTVEEITSALSRIRWLFVIARNSAFVYRGRAVDVRQVGRELGVRYVLEGSVRRDAGRVRVTAQLIEAATGAHIWADRYDRDVSDIFAVQDDIAERVAATLEPTLADAERRRALRKPPERLDAWEACQRALWHFHGNTAAENRIARTFFQQAIALDAGFAPAHHGLAMASLHDGWLYQVTPLTDAIAEGLASARRAVAADAHDAIAQAVLALLTLANGEWEDAAATARVALSLNPSSAFVLSVAGRAFSKGGAPDEAVARLRMAIRASPRDPMLWAWHLWIGWIRFHQNRFEEAIEASHEALRVRPDFVHPLAAIAASLAFLGRIDEARATYRMLREKNPDRLAWMYERLPWDRPEEHAQRNEGLRLAAGELD